VFISVTKLRMFFNVLNGSIMELPFIFEVGRLCSMGGLCI
jgi:hypothetical protein